MQIIDNIKALFRKGDPNLNKTNSHLFNKMAAQFGVVCTESDTMLTAINYWNSLFQYSRTQVMKTVCHEAAKLALTDIDISITASLTLKEDNRVLLNDIMQDLKAKLVKDLEVGIALGGLVIKPTLNGFDLIAPTNFIPISFSSKGELYSAIFIDRLFRNGYIYTKLEYHHFVDNKYVIDNKAFRSKNTFDLGGECSLKDTYTWRDIEAHTEIDNLEKPLFAYFRMPGYNNIDETSSLGISICSPAVEYLCDFDSTYKGFIADMETTRKVIFVNNASMISMPANQKGKRDFVHNPIPNLIVGMNGNIDQIKEFNPSCNVNEFKEALQMLLNLIATSSGFTSGYFVFDSTRKAVTATQIESEDQVTVSTISAIRESLEAAVIKAVEALINTLYLYKKLPSNTYTTTFYARDLSATPAADRAHTLELVKAGYYPLELYLKEYEGFSDDDLYRYHDKIPALTKLNEQNIET